MNRLSGRVVVSVVPTVIFGLPAHVLLIHVVVVLVPLGALFTALSAVWPTARRKLGVISPITCLVALAFVPVTTHAGNYLRGRLDSGHNNSLITRHANLGNTFLWYAIGLFVVSAAVWIRGRREEYEGDASSSGRATSVLTSTWTGYVVAVVAVAVSVVAVVQIYRVGDSGARAAWSGLLQ